MAMDVQSVIQKAIDGDPIITDAVIGVEVKKPGLFQKGNIHLIGSVHSEESRRRAEKIALEHAGGMKVVNELVVKK
jgi:osmotically-inducible protein OsmY